MQTPAAESPGVSWICTYFLFQGKVPATPPDRSDLESKADRRPTECGAPGLQCASDCPRHHIVCMAIKNRKISAKTVSVKIFLSFFQKLFKNITSAAPFASIPAEPESAW